MINCRKLFLALTLLAGLLAGCAAAPPEVEAPELSFDPDRLLLFAEDGLPGSEPEPFGVGWFRGGFHSAPVFSPDGLEFWWAGSYASQTVYFSRYEEGAWTDQERVSFSENIRSYRDPFISPDGLRFYFVSTASLPGQEGTGKENLWMMEWGSGGWTEPSPLPEAINSLPLHWTPSVAANYDLYFAANLDGNPQIYKSEFSDEGYQEPVLVGPPVSSPELEFTPHIAPDQSYLLFSRTPDSSSPARLYITYFEDGGWTDPVLVENVANCISPIVTPDQKYLIYLKDPSALEWRDTSFIEELRPK